MEVGKCHLCGESKELPDSHVWPRFAYKRYASDLSKGGRFADLFTMTLHNKQYTCFWFCTDCERIIGATEDSTARLCVRIEDAPEADQPYDENLLRFTTSISWRTLKYCQDKQNSALESKWEAAKRWKQYIRGTRGGVGPFTQHIYLINDNPHGFDKFLGGVVSPDNSLVLSQIGPLLIVGHLEPNLLSSDEKSIWRRSQILHTWGNITPLRKWVFGNGDPKHHNVTVRFVIMLGSNQHTVLTKVTSANWSGLAKPTVP